jgi:hypothetical protein
MTATLLESPPSASADGPAEAGTTLRRRATGAAFLGAAAITMAGILVTPFENGTSETAYLKSLVAHPKQAMIAAVLLHFGYLLFVPAAFAMARLARRGARKLTAVGIVLAVLGSGLSGLLVTDLYDLSVAQHAGVVGGVPISNMDGVPLAPLAIVSMAFLSSIGMLVGLGLLAAGMWRARLAPVWPPLAIIGGFASAFGAHDLLRTALGFGAMCVAIAFLGITVLRMSDARFAYGSDAR